MTSAFKVRGLSPASESIKAVSQHKACHNTHLPLFHTDIDFYFYTVEKDKNETLL